MCDSESSHVSDSESELSYSGDPKTMEVPKENDKQTEESDPPTTPEFQVVCKALSPLVRELLEDHPDDPIEMVDDQSPSRLEWIHLKRNKGAKSKSLDKLMQMVGLEDIKAFFLRTRVLVQIAKKQKKQHASGEWDIGVVGNPSTGKSTVSDLYTDFMREQGVRVYTDTYSFNDPVEDSVKLELPDYTDGELQQILVGIIADTQWKVKGGPKGENLLMMVRMVGSGRGRGFRNIDAVKDAWKKALNRQMERIYHEQRQGIHSDCLLVTKEDLVGPDPTETYRKSPAWAQLRSMIGLEAVKSSIEVLFDRATRNYLHLQRGQVPVRTSLNRVFLGPPGTGKTTVAKLYAQILVDLGLLSSAEVVVKNPSDFIGHYLGWSEAKTKHILKETVGKVLIIDDAYMLYQSVRSCSFRTGVIDTLVAILNNDPGQDRCVILAGYEEQMQEMFRKSNPGLARRFALDDAFHFTNYSVEQLGQILDLKLNRQGLHITDEARKVAMHMLERASERPNFGNGGDVENLISHAKDSYEKRAPATQSSASPTDIVLITEDFDLHHKRHEQAASKCRSRFEDLVGVDEIIIQLQEYQTAVAGMRRVGIDPRPYTPFTFVFRGPPGTGKTSTARKMGQIYYDMGFLSEAEVVECSVNDLIGNTYLSSGQKVVELLDRALGKVLFIDEAYRLATGAHERQAVEELVDALTKARYSQKLIVVLAGYDREMVQLMQVNRGLRSRFATELVFRPLSPTDCFQLLQKELESAGIRVLGETGDVGVVTQIFSRLLKTKDWGNARDVKRLASNLIRYTFTQQDTDGEYQTSIHAICQQLESAQRKMGAHDVDAPSAVMPE